MKKIRAKITIKEGWEDVDEVLHFESLPYIPEVICTELISRHNNNLLASHFEIKKTRELVTQKYYQSIRYHNIEAYLKDCDVYLASKMVKHKSYRDLQLLFVLTYC